MDVNFKARGTGLVDSSSGEGDLPSVSGTMGNHGIEVSNERFDDASYALVGDAQLQQRSASNCVDCGCFDGIASALGSVAFAVENVYRDFQRDNTLDNVHNEQSRLNVANVTHFHGKSDSDFSQITCQNPRASQNNRVYDVGINDDNPVGLGRTSPALIEIAELHEKTHGTADQAYSQNIDQSRLEIFHGDKYLESYDAIDKRVGKLDEIVKNDPLLSEDSREEIGQRVSYARQPTEYDPVINELVLYTKLHNIPAASDTAKAVVTLANENLERRRPGGPDLTPHLPI